MSSDLFFENKKYISAKDAASLTSYSKDYIGQLCRAQKVDSKRVGHTWYVCEESVLKYKNAPTTFDFSKNFKSKAPNNFQNNLSEQSFVRIAPILEEETIKYKPAEIKLFGKSYDIKPVHKILFSGKLNSLKYFSAVAALLVFLIGTTVVGSGIVGLVSATSKIPNSLSKMSSRSIFVSAEKIFASVSSGISSAPENLYRSLDNVLSVYSSDLSAGMIYFGTEIKNIGLSFAQGAKKLAENPPLHIIDGIEHLAVSEKHGVDAGLSVSSNSLYFAYVQTFSFISDSVGGIPFVKNVAVSGVKNLTAGAVLAIQQKALTPVDQAGVAIYQTVNDFFSRNIYGPLASLFNSRPTISAPTVLPSVSKIPSVPIVLKNSQVPATVVEKIYQPVVASQTVAPTIIGVSETDLDLRLQELDNKISSELAQLSTGGGGNITNVYQEIAGSQRIDQLTGTSITSATINNSTITGGSIAVSSISTDNLAVGTSTFSGTATFENGANFSGNVGIGTTSPAFPLDVNGIVNATALYVNGAPYIGSQWATSGNNISYDAGFVGIGTTTPEKTLDVFGDARVSGTLTVGSLVSGGQTIGGNFAVTGTTTLADLLVTGTTTLQSATSTTFFASILHASTGLIDNFNSTVANITGLTVSNSTTTNATTTNSFSNNFVAENLSATNSTTTNLAITGALTLGGVAESSLLSTNASGVVVATSTPTFGAFNATSTTATSTIAGGLDVTKGLQLNSGYIFGAGLNTTCDLQTGKLIWNAATGQFSCGLDAGSTSGLGGLRAQYSPIQTGPTQTLASSTSVDANLQMTLTSAGDVTTFTPVWFGTLAANRLNSNVVQGIINDTNIIGTISNQILTLGWSGTLADGRIASAANWNSAYNTITASSTDWNTAFLNRITSASLPLSISNNAISISQANSTTNGYLASADFSKFNSATTTAGTGLTYTAGANTFSLNLGYGNAWTALQQFGGNASTTGLSAGFAYFGTIATSSFSNTGALTLGGVAVNSLLSTNASGVVVATSTPTFGAFNATSTTATSTIAAGLDVTKGLQLNAGYIFGAGLTNCSVSTGKLVWNSATGQFACGTDAGSSGVGVTSLNGLTVATQKFATSSNDGGWGFTSLTDTHTLNIPTASATNLLGLLSNTDWTTFNAKQSALGFTPANSTVNLTAGAGLTGGGNLTTDRTFAIDFTHANSWTGLQTFTNASSTLFSSTYASSTNAYFGTLSLGGTDLQTTLNGKQSTISASWPITLSSNTVGFNGLSTSTAGVVGNIPYFTSANTFGNIGTTTLSASGLLSLSGVTSILGSSPITLSLPVTKGYFVVGSDTGAAQATSTIFVSSTGNVGIGTTTPGTLLSIGNVGIGTINISPTATSTFGYGINILNGCFSINGNCLTQNIGTVTSVGLSDSNGTLTIGSTPVTGSGTITATLNLAHSNTWTVNQSFNYSSSTQYSSFITASTTNLLAGTISLGGTDLQTTLNSKQASLGFTPENVANKSTVTTLGTSDTLYPTQNAVKTYVDTGLGTKQNTLSASWPITLTSSTLGFNGLSTSSAAVIGNIPYFTGVNTFGNVATSSSNTASTIVARDSAGNFAAGTITATTFTGALTGTASGNLALTGGTLSGGLTLSSLPINSLMAINSAGLIVSTSSPTFGNFNATSTSVASTIGAGGLNMSGNIAMGTHDISGGGTFTATNINGTTALQVNGTTVLSGSTLGSSITASSLTSVGTLTGLTIGTLNGPLQANVGVVSATTSIGALYGGTGQTTYTTGDLLYASNGTTLSKLGIGTIGTTGILGVSGGLPAWVATSSLNIDFGNTVGTLPVNRGGTGDTTLTAGQLLYGDGTGAIGTVATSSINTASTIVFRDSSGNFSAGTITAALTGNASTATTLQNSRDLYGFSFNGGAGTVSGVNIIGSSYGGTGNGFTKFTGPTTAEKTFTLPDANATLARTDAGQTFSGVQTFSYSTTTYASFTTASTTNLILNNNSFNNLLGSGLSNSNGALTIGPLAITNAMLAGSIDLTTKVTGTLPFGNGGTGQTAFSPNSIITTNSAGTALIATGTQLTVGNLIATTSANSYFTGNLGIGTTTPGTLLSLGNVGIGTINISPTATSTFGYGLNILNGCFAVNGTCLGNYIFTNTIGNGGTGSTSFAPNSLIASNADGTALVATSTPTFGWFNATSTTATSTVAGNMSISGNLDLSGVLMSHGSLFSGTQWTTSGSDIYYNTGAVGIGTPTPTGQLSIVTPDSASAALVLDTATSPTAEGILFKHSGYSYAYINLVGNHDLGFSGDLTPLWDDSVDVVTPSLGTASMRWHSLHIGLGASQFDGSVAMTAGATVSSGLGVGGGLSITSGDATFAGNLGIGTTTPGTLLSIGNVGIGTINISPTATSTFGYGINILNGCFSINGNCLTQNIGTVTSVGLSDSNGTLTIGSTPVTGSGIITATLNLAHSNTWTVNQSFNYSSSTQYSSFITASTTNLILNGNSFNNLLGSGLAISGGGALGIASNGVTVGMLAQAGANTLLGNATGVTGNITAISTSTLNIGGSAATVTGAAQTSITSVGTLTGLTLSTLNGPLQANAGVVSATTSIGALYGGTGQTTYTTGDLLYASNGTTLSKLAIGTIGTTGILGVSGGLPAWVATSSLNIDFGNTVGTLPVNRGGTGQTTLSAGQLLYGNGTGAIGTVATSSINTASTIVFRDASGNFSAGTITAALTGNASTATKLAATKNINGVAFDGSADITVTADATTLTGTSLKSTVIGSSLTSVGTLTGLTLSTLNGPLQANAGVVSATTSIGVLYGGTGATDAATARTNLGVVNYTDAAVNSYINASTTIPKLYTTNTFTGLQTLNGGLTMGGTLAMGGNNITSTGSLGSSGSKLTAGFFTDLTVTNAIAGSVTGSAASFTGSLVGDVTGTQGATVVGNAAVIAKVLTGYVSGSGTVAATDSILTAIQKLNGNDALKLPLTGGTISGNLTLSSLPINSLMAINASGLIVSTSTPTFGNFNATSTTATSTISTGGLTVGTNQFVIQQNSGNIGMGIATPSAKLQILGSDILNTTQTLNVSGSSGTGLVVTNAGNVGIGTTSPQFPLDVNGKIGINGTQVLYLPDQTNFTGTLIVGDAGANLLHTSGSDGQYNTFIGIGTGSSTTAGSYNTADGYQSLFSNTTGYVNTANGFQTLYSNTTGYRNTALGLQSLYSNTSGVGNTALGSQTLYNNTTGNFNEAIGLLSMVSNTTGKENNAIGAVALLSNTTGNYNNTIGNDSQYSNISGSYNNSIGDSALNYNLGSGNTALGNHAMLYNTTGNENIAIGDWAGAFNLTTGSNNIIIGAHVDAPVADSSYQLNIGNTIYGDLSTGNVGIGTTSPSSKLDVWGNVQVSNGNHLYIYDANNSTASDFNQSGGNFNFKNGNGALNFQAYGNTSFQYYNGSAYTSAITVLSTSGNVGIGTTSPASKLHVAYDATSTASTLFALQLGASALTSPSANGTYIGINAPTGFTGDFLNFQNKTNSTYAAKISYYGGIFGQVFEDNQNNLFALDNGIANKQAFQLANTYPINWSNDATWYGTEDVGLVRNAAGVLKVTDASTGWGTLIAGNVGIGTTSPSATLQVYGSSGVNPFLVSSSTGTGLMVIQQNGNVGIGTTSPSSILTVSGSSYFSGSLGIGTNTLSYSLQVSSTTPTIDINDTNGATDAKHWLLSNNDGTFNIGTSTDANASATSSAFSIQSGGTAMGIGTSSPWRTLSVTGNVGFDGLTAGAGAGSLCLSSTNEVTYSAGSTCTVSSERFKNNIQTSTEGLDFVMQLRPVSFYYNSNIGIPGEQLGFIAEEVQQLDPRLVVHDAQGLPYSVRYENITAVLAAAIQDLNYNMMAVASTTATSTPESQSFAASFFSNLFSHIGAWLADATNGIGDIFANAFHAKQEICVDNQCLNANDVRSLLALAHGGIASGASAGTGSGAATSASGSPLSLIVNGNNPANIFVGDSYSDMGAMISPTSPTTDLNLGIVANVDGGATTTPASISIDTTVAGTHSIVYSVTDSAGVTASATRTVVVAPIVGSAGLQTIIATTTPTTTETATTTASTDTTATTTPTI